MHQGMMQQETFVIWALKDDGETAVVIIPDVSLCALPSFSHQGHFIVWEGAPGARMAWKGHKRHVFLFKNYIVICKPKRDTKTDTYSYIFKNIMKV